jgi:hypothetical protein
MEERKKKRKKERRIIIRNGANTESPKLPLGDIIIEKLYFLKKF